MLIKIFELKKKKKKKKKKNLVATVVRRRDKVNVTWLTHVAIVFSLSYIAFSIEKG